MPRFAAPDCRHLMRLSLRSNPIVEVPAAAFEHTPDLVSLDLGRCRLEAVDGAALRRLEKLEYLRLDGNRIQTLSPDEAFPTALRYVGDLPRY